MDTTIVGAFEADKIDELYGMPDDETTPKNNKRKSSKKKKKQERRIVTLSNINSAGMQFYEEGTWHQKRRAEILKKHPEVRKLMGQNPWSGLLIFVLLYFHWFMATQIAINLPFWGVFLLSWVVGAVTGFQLQVLGHEGTHRLITKNGPINRILSTFAFLPVFIGPFASIWLYEHAWHHNVVVDKCLRFGQPNSGPIRKIIVSFLFINIVNLGLILTTIFTAIKTILHFLGSIVGICNRTPKFEGILFAPYNRFPQIINGWWWLSILMCIGWNYFHYYYWGWTPIIYYFFSGGFTNGLHPLGMRNVQEHYWRNKEQPTYSVYSSLHTILLNIGYHVEHHDFSTIPWNRLPLLRKIAPEYYNNLLSYPSYTNVLWEFLTNPKINDHHFFSEAPLVHTLKKDE